MIKFYKKTKLAKLTGFLSAALFMIFAQNAFAFPGGNYTIDQNSAASVLNYTSFTAFANDLKGLRRGDSGPDNYATGGAGVQGAIDVDVKKGVYTERFQLNQILGVDSRNTVTINGNGNRIEYAATAAGQGTIEMDGTDYFTFIDLEIAAIEQSSIGGKCVWIYNSANYNSFLKSKMKFTYANTSQGSAYIWICNSTTTNPYVYTDAGNNNVIDGCDLSSPGNTTWGPYHGVVLVGNTSRSTGNNTNSNTISNCNIKDFYRYGVFAYYTGGNLIKNNTIHNTGTTRYMTKYGIYTQQSDFIIEENRIYNLNGNTPQGYVIYPVNLSNGNNTGFVINNSKFRNNVLHAFGTSTLQNYIYWYSGTGYGYHLDIESNTFSFSHPTMTNANGSYVLLAGYYYRNLENNILELNLQGTSGTRYLFQDYACQGYGNFRNNNIFYGPRSTSGGTTNIYSYYDRTCTQNTTFQDMITAGLPTSNISVDPEFVDYGSNSIMIPSSMPMANKGMNVTGITKDIVGVTRPSRPDIGAYEYTVDLAITAFPMTFPVPTCAGYTATVAGTIKNNGIYAINNPKVAYKINGLPQVEYIIPVKLNPNASYNFSFPTPTKFSINGPNTITLKLALNDDVPSNDQMSVNFNVTPAPGGSVTTQNTALSSVHAELVTTGKPDLTFPNEKMVYNYTAPSRVGYVNSQYGTLWSGSVSAIKLSDMSSANALVSLVAANGGADMQVHFMAGVPMENETFEISTTFTNIATGCDTTFKRKILVAPKGVVGYKLPTVVCEKTEIIFENLSSVSSGALEYEWSFGDGETSDEASPIHLYRAFGTYTVNVKAKTNPYGFVTDSTFTLSITEVPTALILNTNACEGVDIKLRNGTVYGGSGSTTYTWDFGDNTAPLIVNNKNDLFKQYPNQGGYLVKLSATADGCTNTTQKYVYQFARPVANFTQSTGTCLNTEFTFKNNSTIANGLFGNEWDFNDAGNKATLLDPTYNFQTAGTKNVVLKVISEFGCEATVTVPVVVKQIPTTNFTYPFACSRTATQFTNTTNLNGEALATNNSIFWNFGDGFTSTASSPIKNWTSVGPKMVTLTTNLQNGCSTSITKEVNVGVQPEVKFNVEDRCAGSDVPFANLTTFDQGTIKYTWNFGDGNTSAVRAPVHSYGSGVSQTFTVQLKAEVVGGCSDSLSKTININPLPATCTFDIVGKESSATTAGLGFKPVGTSTGVTYTWFTGDGNSVTGSNPTYRYIAPGKYCITMIAKDANSGCECSQTKCFTMTTDINSAESMNNAVSIYPNPNSGIFTVALNGVVSTEMSVLVYNTIGELVKTINVNSTSTTIDLSDVASGVYTVKVIAENQIATKKVTINR